MKEFGIIVRIGGRTRGLADSAKKLKYANGPLYGLTEYVGPKNGGITGCRVWIYSRQSKREIADTFFHEMSHVFLQMIGGIKKQGSREEMLARWIGHLSKAMLADYSKQYGGKP